MDMINIPAHTSIKRFFSGFFTTILCIVFIDALQSLFFNGTLDIFYDTFISPFAFVGWCLYWLSTTFQTKSVSFFNSAFRLPEKRIWLLEVLLLLLSTLALSISALFIFFIAITRFFPNLDIPSSLPTLPTNAIWATVCLIAIFLKTVIITPVIEELIFRGAFFSHLKVHYSPVKAMLIISAIFAILHPDPLGTFIFSVVACILTAKYNSLIPAIVLHFINNGIGFIATLIGLSDTSSSTYHFDNSVLFSSIGVLTLTAVLLGIYIKQNIHCIKATHQSTPYEHMPSKACNNI